MGKADEAVDVANSKPAKVIAAILVVACGITIVVAVVTFGTRRTPSAVSPGKNRRVAFAQSLEANYRNANKVITFTVSLSDSTELVVDSTGSPTGFTDGLVYVSEESVHQALREVGFTRVRVRYPNLSGEIADVKIDLTR